MFSTIFSGAPKGDAVRLGSGSTMVTTDKGMKTQVQRLQIAPTAQVRTSYRVVRGDGQVLVAALHGSVNISDGSDSKTVAEGNTTSVPDPAPQGGATPGTAGGGLSKTKLGIILAGVAAGTALLVYETTKSPVTPP